MVTTTAIPLQSQDLFPVHVSLATHPLGRVMSHMLSWAQEQAGSWRS